MDVIDVLKGKEGFEAFDGASKEIIELAEKELSLEFSDEYKKYISSCGFAIYDGHEITGICGTKRLNVVYATLSERELTLNVPPDCYVIEQLNIDGIVIWQTKTGEIYETSPNNKPIKIFDSLKEYILST